MRLDFNLGDRGCFDQTRDLGTYREKKGWRKLKEIQVDIHDISPDLLRPTLMTVYVPKKGCWVFSEETRLREEMGKTD